jgi:hypothetical protein
MAVVRLFVVALLVVLLAAPAAIAAGEPASMLVTVSDRSPYSDGTVEVMVRVFDEVGEPVDVVDPGDLIEIRSFDGTVTYRPSLERVSTGTYRTMVSFPGGGDWEIVADPDRTGLSDEPPIQINVRSGLAPGRTGTSVAFIALLVLVLLGAVIIPRWLRRPRHQPKAGPEPEAHDTWWW